MLSLLELSFNRETFENTFFFHRIHDLYIKKQQNKTNLKRKAVVKKTNQLNYNDDTNRSAVARCNHKKNIHQLFNNLSQFTKILLGWWFRPK